MSASSATARDCSALAEIARIERECARLPQTRNMATAALMVTAAALRREESRGGHFRSDFPKTDRSRRGAPSSRWTRRARSRQRRRGDELAVA
jgi:aspartate oxidase